MEYWFQAVYDTYHIYEVGVEEQKGSVALTCHILSSITMPVLFTFTDTKQSYKHSAFG